MFPHFNVSLCLSPSPPKQRPHQETACYRQDKETWKHEGQYLHPHAWNGRACPRDVRSQKSACRCRGLRDAGSIPGLGRSAGAGNGNSFQCSCLENPMDGGAWRAAVHGGCKESDTTERLSTHEVVLTLNASHLTSDMSTMAEQPYPFLGQISDLIHPESALLIPPKKSVAQQ